MRPEDIHLAVVGTGPIGLEAAAWAKHRGYQLTIFEKQAAIGGDWLQWGNPWSKLQSHRDSYLFSGPVTVPGQEQLPSYPSLEAMLGYFQAYTDSAGISKHIKFNCKVTGRSAVESNGKLKVFFTEADAGDQSLEVTHIFVAPGRVNKRREVRFRGEADFSGRVAWGNGKDLVGYVFADKHVVIIGHGSFAIENARHALEQGAASVVILARHKQVVMSRAAGFFVDRNVHREMPTTVVVEALCKAYNLIDCGSEELEQLFFSPCKTMLPTSDFYFLAQAARKLTVVIGTVVGLGKSWVESSTGLNIPADVVIKCTGFSHDAALDVAMRADLKKGGRVANFHYADATSTMSRNSYFAGSSGGYRHVSPCYGVIAQVENLPSCDLAASNNVLRTRVGNRSRTQQSLEEFLAEQRIEWSDYCALLGVDIDYPYSLQDLDDWEALLENCKPLLDKRCGDNGIAFNVTS